MSGQTWVGVCPRGDGEAMRWYQEARVRGIQVHHREGRKCFSFDSVDGTPGVFREVGSVVFDKKTRRWHARASADCNAVDLSTIVAMACAMADAHGQRPGYALRPSPWVHTAEGFTGNPTVGMWVAYRLGVEDLQQEHAEQLASPADIRSLAHLVDERYDKLLRGAQG